MLVSIWQEQLVENSRPFLICEAPGGQDQDADRDPEHPISRDLPQVILGETVEEFSSVGVAPRLSVDRRQGCRVGGIGILFLACEEWPFQFVQPALRATDVEHQDCCRLKEPGDLHLLEGRQQLLQMPVSLVPLALHRGAHALPRGAAADVGRLAGVGRARIDDLQLTVDAVHVAGGEEGDHEPDVTPELRVAVAGLAAQADQLLGHGHSFVQVLRPGEGGKKSLVGCPHGLRVLHAFGDRQRLSTERDLLLHRGACRHQVREGGKKARASGAIVFA